MADLKARINHAEQTANTNKAAAEFMHQMINAGHIKMDTNNTIVLNAATGEHRFGVNAPNESSSF